MAYPPAALPTTRTNNSAVLDNHPGDHNAICQAINDMVAEMGVHAPGKEVNYTQITAPVTVTSTTEATGTVCITTPAITFTGAPVMVEVFAPYVQPAAVAGAVVFVNLFEGATEIGRLGVTGNPAAGQFLWPFTGRLRFTPTAAAHTYSVTAYQVSGNGTFGAGAGGGNAYLPAFIRFTYV
jgi:hypothetical protein